MQHLFQTDQDESPATLQGGPGLSAGEVCVRVVVERGIDAEGAGDGFTYRAGGLDLAVGQRVEVPLGRNNKPAQGIVVAVGGADLLGGLPPSKVKPILRATGTALSERLVALARWMAEYYICPLGIVLATMMPASVKRGTGLRQRIEVAAASPSEAAAILEQRRLTPAVKAVWERVQEYSASTGGASIEPRELAMEVGARNLGPINRLIEAGLLKQIRRQVVKGLEQIWQHARLEPDAALHELTSAQRTIVEGISNTSGEFAVHLLRGITGSGKTEVYMQLIARTIELSQRALILVPEIALTPQTAGRFLARFGSTADEGRVAVLHSGMPASERHRQWALASSGRAKVVVGARSAIFAPLTQLGLIIVDEEHASDYKQDQAPRYNARDVAIKRAQLEGCPVVLGSATPSLESWLNAGGHDATHRRKSHFLWQLTERVGGGRLPPVEIVDLAQERRIMASAGRGSSREIRAIGPRLENALGQTLESGGQAILLLNRRGWSSYICCPDANCGWVAGCEQCDASMVMHKWRPQPKGQQHGASEFVRCHHCLAEQLVPRVCAVCNKKTILLGVGTQRLEEELVRLLKDRLHADEMVRIDGDSMRTAADYFRVLSRFARGEVKVLLGTQMLAKGLDFPNVQLVGIINADTGLSLPDFRASERTFQLVSQVAGRAGRSVRGGRVLVQTINPHEPAIRLASQHDYGGFAQRELAIRAEAGLPPVTRMARIVVRDESPSRAEDHAAEIARALHAGGWPITVQGPAPCPVTRIAGEYRFAVEVIGRRAGDVQRALAGARSAGLFRSETRTAVDVDPTALM